MAYNVISCKKSPETLKKSKALISLCNLGPRAHKPPKRGVAEAHFAQFLYRYGIYWLAPY